MHHEEFIKRRRRLFERDPSHDDESFNFNDRADGYGFGPSESKHDSLPYEQNRSLYRFNESRDVNGQPNPYGPIDQYSFREAPLGSGEGRYKNDDYSAFGGPNYREHSYSHQKMRGRGPKGYRPKDERIYEEVCSALTEDPILDASTIEVRVAEGIVYLSGELSTRNDKKLAEAISERLPGVVDVRNSIRLS
jgi:hypothetical protein